VEVEDQDQVLLQVQVPQVLQMEVVLMVLQEQLTQVEEAVQIV
tara:strand:+ start:309 stop:437 length:129 start_codon:yes stop_codon:yes gene_type:complete